ncbi:enoyl-CoA hydratase-related protein [Massilia putida]|uniref:enoyl-CoA hydratase-related protein n=1 Tax=Massilia putida TaxID=1141883 RepID=UPI001E2B26C9|nr:enoyl-CoA hydratase-related protein [Massilia putida]
MNNEVNIGSTMTSEDSVLYEQVGEHIAVVTLNRPQARNAINPEVAQALHRIREQIDADERIRVAILTGSGTGVFCAGADLKAVTTGRAGASGLSTEGGGFAGFVKARRAKPWIAAVRGKAYGGGFELVLACDLAVAGQSAQFALPEAKIGVLAAAGGAFRIAQLLPRALANEILVTGNAISAGRAYDLGLLNRVVDDEEVLAEALRLAADIVKNAPLSVKASLDIVRAAASPGEDAMWQINDEWAQRIVHSEDAKEGPRAFLEKRAPRWAGR